MKQEPTEAVRKIVEAMVSHALARCERLGISPEDFYQALLEEKRIRSSGDLVDLLDRTFRRLTRPLN